MFSKLFSNKFSLLLMRDDSISSLVSDELIRVKSLSMLSSLDCMRPVSLNSIPLVVESKFLFTVEDSSLNLFS